MKTLDFKDRLLTDTVVKHFYAAGEKLGMSELEILQNLTAFLLDFEDETYQKKIHEAMINDKPRLMQLRLQDLRQGIVPDGWTSTKDNNPPHTGMYRTIKIVSGKNQIISIGKGWFNMMFTSYRAQNDYWHVADNVLVVGWRVIVK